MTADILLDRLQGVRRTAPGRWLARCPAHDDRRPSLAVREAEDGRLLIYCFAGCSVGDVMRALGLDLHDLFDRPLGHRHGPIRHPFSPAAVLRAIAGEAMIVAVAGRDALDGKAIEADRERLLTAVTRITEAVRYA